MLSTLSTSEVQVIIKISEIQPHYHTPAEMNMYDRLLITEVNKINVSH